MVLNTLSKRFLGLTIVFLVIAEVLIFLPSIARFRFDYLQNRLEMAQLAALAPVLGMTPSTLLAEAERRSAGTAANDVDSTERG